jgi:1,4-dihydroxy-6-naphthoate synthase
MLLRCAISPDADDRFMFRAITEGLLDTEGLRFHVVEQDTDLLNRMAEGVGPDVTAISIAHYPRVADRYLLLRHGGSVGRGYGPVLVAPRPLLSLKGLRIGVPGLGTTAYTVLKLVEPDFTPVVIPIVPPERSFQAVRAGEVDAVLLIHEGRLTYREQGFVEVLDTGRWWHAQTGLPLPLGGNVIARHLPAEVRARADRVLRASIAHALADREAAIDWLLATGSGALRSREQVDTYLSLYANADTLDYGEDGIAGIRELLRRGAGAGVLPAAGDPDFA